MDFLFFLKSYTCYKFKAKDEYSLHSPFMFDFFVNGLKKPCKSKDIYFDSKLKNIIPKSKSLRKFLFKAFQYFKSQDIEVVYVKKDDFSLDCIENFKSYSSNTAIVIEGIYKNKSNYNLWKSLQANQDFKICSDFFDFGFVFLTDKPLKKQNYVLRKR
ncbi:MAG: hypothetical protein J6U84_01775 [Bacteroidales bacterium]|nr:hypothetical protein [Bacteroidales bacterium]